MKQNKIIFILLAAFLALYITATQFLAYSSIFASRLDNLIASVCFIVIFALTFSLLLYRAHIFKDKYIHINETKEKLSIKVFLAAFLICFAVLAIMLLAYYPGGISPDNLNQWTQVHSLKFDNWHPVIHTLMIWFITRISDNYSFVIFMQIFIFSIGVGYLISTLKAWGIRTGLLIFIELCIILNPMIRNIMMFAWKDSALAILLLYLLIQTVNIYLSEGEWLKKYGNTITFSVCAALASLVRHNGFFYTFPLLGLVFLLYIKKVPQAALALGLSVVIIFGIKGPLYRAIKVTYPEQTYVESIGLPMTIMSDVYVKNPGALPPEARQMMARIAPIDTWKSSYVFGNFNSIKFKSDVLPAIRDIPVKDFISMTLKTIKADKRNSFLAFVELTNMVWKTSGEPKGITVVYNVGEAIGYPYKNTRYNKIGGILVHTMDMISYTPFLKWLLIMTGTQMLLLMLIGLFSFYSNGIKALIFVVPSVVYNLGTMLLLCGDDYRFFLFNSVITMPACLILLGRKTNEMFLNRTDQ